MLLLVPCCGSSRAAALFSSVMSVGGAMVNWTIEVQSIGRSFDGECSLMYLCGQPASERQWKQHWRVQVGRNGLPGDNNYLLTFCNTLCNSGGGGRGRTRLVWWWLLRQRGNEGWTIEHWRLRQIYIGKFRLIFDPSIFPPNVICSLIHQLVWYFAMVNAALPIHWRKFSQFVYPSV